MPRGIYKHSKNPKQSKRMSSLTEEKGCNWKGDKVGYHGIHKWVIRWKGKPDTCEMCGRSGLKGRFIHWANIDHTYKRILDDYIRLCSTCHRKHDVEKGIYIPTNQHTKNKKLKIASQP